MSVESQDRAVISAEVKDALLGATESGLFLAMVQVRETEDGTLVADVYGENGEVEGTYELDILVGRPVPQS